MRRVRDSAGREQPASSNARRSVRRRARRRRGVISSYFDENRGRSGRKRDGLRFRNRLKWCRDLRLAVRVRGRGTVPLGLADGLSVVATGELSQSWSFTGQCDVWCSGSANGRASRWRLRSGAVQDSARVIRMEGCQVEYLYLCWVKPSQTSADIFGFAVFVHAFALLVLIYMVSETKYQFRIAAAPIPLWRSTFAICGIIGVGTLVTDTWFAHQWLLPRILSSQSMWQAFFGAVFLLVVMCWLWFAFIRPPIFGRWNDLKYTRALYEYVLRGSETELPVIAAELGRSAPAIVKFAQEKPQSNPHSKITAAQVANDLMLLIGTRKFCRYVVSSSPGTAIAFFEAMSELKKYNLPISQFASNVSTEAIRNKDSILYHEDAGYYSGLLGYLKPFSGALYGNFELVEALTRANSPLDIDFHSRASWDAEQLEAYCRSVLMTLDNYLERGAWGRHSFALYRAFGSIENSCSDISRLNGMEAAWSDTEELRRLGVVMDFVRDAIALLDKYKPEPYKLRRRGNYHARQDDFYDLVAKMMFEIVFAAGYLKGPADLCWSVQHNSIWSSVFSLQSSKAYKIVQFKLRRLLYDEILQLQKFPNFKSSRILGFCLAVMGIVVGNKRDFDRGEYAIRKAVVRWTTKYFLSLHAAQPYVAETCLLGPITLDEKNSRLVRTYSRNLDLEQHRDFLGLDPVDLDRIRPRKPREASEDGAA